MSHRTRAVVDDEYNVTGTDLRQVFQLASRIRIITKDKGTDHSSVAAAAVILTYPIDIHNPVGCCAGHFIFVRSRRLVRTPYSVLGPIQFQLPQELQHIFLSHRLSIGQAAAPCPLGCKR